MTGPRVGRACSTSCDNEGPENPLGGEWTVAGDGNASVDWIKTFVHSRDRRASDKVASGLSGTLIGRLKDMATELEELGGISASRVETIVRGGEEATNGELEELGYLFVELMRALKDE